MHPLNCIAQMLREVEEDSYKSSGYKSWSIKEVFDGSEMNSDISFSNIIKDLCPSDLSDRQEFSHSSNWSEMCPNSEPDAIMLSSIEGNSEDSENYYKNDLIGTRSPPDMTNSTNALEGSFKPSSLMNLQRTVMGSPTIPESKS